MLFRSQHRNRGNDCENDLPLSSRKRVEDQVKTDVSPVSDGDRTTDVDQPYEGKPRKLIGPSDGQVDDKSGEYLGGNDKDNDREKKDDDAVCNRMNHRDDIISPYAHPCQLLSQVQHRLK